MKLILYSTKNGYHNQQYFFSGFKDFFKFLLSKRIIKKYEFDYNNVYAVIRNVGYPFPLFEEGFSSTLKEWPIHVRKYHSYKDKTTLLFML